MLLKTHHSHLVRPFLAFLPDRKRVLFETRVEYIYLPCLPSAVSGGVLFPPSRDAWRDVRGVWMGRPCVDGR